MVLVQELNCVACHEYQQFQQHKRKLQKSDETHANPPLSEAIKLPDFPVTSCLHFVTTNVDFAYIESE